MKKFYPHHLDITIANSFVYIILGKLIHGHWKIIE
jgi:hypothetical protein